MSDLPNVENHMVVPYCDDETSERFLPDEDAEYERIRQIEIDETAERLRKHRIASLSDTLYEIGSLPGLGRRQVG